MREIDEKEALNLAKKIVPILDGLSIGQAGWVLTTTKGWIESTNPIDVDATLAVLEYETGTNE